MAPSFKINQTYGLKYNDKKRFILVKKVLEDRIHVLDYNIENTQERIFKTFLIEKCKYVKLINFIVPDEDIESSGSSTSKKVKPTIVIDSESEFDCSSDEEKPFVYEKEKTYGFIYNKKEREVKVVNEAREYIEGFEGDQFKRFLKEKIQKPVKLITLSELCDVDEKKQEPTREVCDCTNDEIEKLWSSICKKMSQTTLENEKKQEDLIKAVVNDDEELEISRELFNPIVIKKKERDSNKETDGCFETFHPNGNTNIICTLLNGKKEGEYKEYYDNGSLKVVATYSNDLLEGVIESYFPSTNKYKKGNKMIQCIYKNGEREGLFEEWYENGMKKEAVIFSKGVVMTEVQWDEKGNCLRRRTNFKTSDFYYSYQIGKTYKIVYWPITNIEQRVEKVIKVVSINDKFIIGETDNTEKSYLKHRCQFMEEIPLSTDKEAANLIMSNILEMALKLKEDCKKMEKEFIKLKSFNLSEKEMEQVQKALETFNKINL